MENISTQDWQIFAILIIDTKAQCYMIVERLKFSRRETWHEMTF